MVELFSSDENQNQANLLSYFILLFLFDIFLKFASYFGERYR